MSDSGIAPAPEGGDEVDERQLDAQDRARRRVALAQIRQYPDAVLRMRAREVEQFDEDMLRLTERMKALMQEANGVGLAANQVGVVRRVFVFRHGEDEEPVACVNPRLVGPSEERASTSASSSTSAPGPRYGPGTGDSVSSAPSSTSWWAARYDAGVPMSRQ